MTECELLLAGSFKMHVLQLPIKTPPFLKYIWRDKRRYCIRKQKHLRHKIYKSVFAKMAMVMAEVVPVEFKV